MSRQQIPTTDSIRQLASFWDAHDVTDFDDELEEVTEPVFERSTGEVVAIRLGPADATAVEQLARSRGIGVEVLIGQWIREKVAHGA